ncbi:MAG TPA: carboxypeptidase-like regulatory domain-containing protein, partial [Thermoanaerobaculia bacterium]|nr:carboxypeptidase-like regulatory domain-containing protein [Thermoanaerobaculia bacterium]
MRIRLLLTPLVFVLLAALAGAAPQTSIPVSGLIQDPGGAPLAGARVLLLPTVSTAEGSRLELAGQADPEPVKTATTLADGRFRIEAPAAGMWKIAVQAKGLVPREVLLYPLTEETELSAVRLERDLGLAV